MKIKCENCGLIDKDEKFENGFVIKLQNIDILTIGGELHTCMPCLIKAIRSAWKEDKK